MISSYSEASARQMQSMTQRWMLGESIAELAAAYAMSRHTVEAILREALKQTVALVAEQERAKAQDLTTAPSPSDTSG